MNETLLHAATILFVLGFLLWELPRSFKLMDEEYTRGLYPDTGKVLDFILLVIGAVAAFLFYQNTNGVLSAMKMPTFYILFSIVFLAVPALILLGYLKRLAKLINEGKSVTVFLVQAFLDLAHSAFFLGFSMLFVPTVIFFITKFVFQ